MDEGAEAMAKIMLYLVNQPEEKLKAPLALLEEGDFDQEALEEALA